MHILILSAASLIYLCDLRINGVGFFFLGGEGMVGGEFYIFF